MIDCLLFSKTNRFRFRNRFFVNSTNSFCLLVMASASKEKVDVSDEEPLCKKCKGPLVDDNAKEGEEGLTKELKDLKEKLAKEKESNNRKSAFWYNLNMSSDSDFVSAHMYRINDNRPFKDQYRHEDLVDYERRRVHRLKNPTGQDDMNRFKYGDRWRKMINIPKPPKIPHPDYVKMMSVLEPHNAVRQEFENRQKWIARFREEVDKRNAEFDRKAEEAKVSSSSKDQPMKSLDINYGQKNVQLDSKQGDK